MTKLCGHHRNHQIITITKVRFKIKQKVLRQNLNVDTYTYKKLKGKFQRKKVRTLIFTQLFWKYPTSHFKQAYRQVKTLQTCHHDACSYEILWDIGIDLLAVLPATPPAIGLWVKQVSMNDVMPTSCNKLHNVYCRSNGQCICLLSVMDKHQGQDTVLAGCNKEEGILRDFCIQLHLCYL